MITQMFRRSVLYFKHDSRIFVKYSVPVRDHFNNVPYRNINISLFSKNKVMLNYFTDERNFTGKPQNFATKQLNTNILKGPLCCKCSTIFTGTNSVNLYPITVNSVRQFSSSTVSPVTEMIMYPSGIIQTIAESFPVQMTMDLLKTMHSCTGLPWWATIILLTISLRTFVGLPLTIYQHFLLAKLRNVHTELKAASDKYKMAGNMSVTSLGWKPAYVQQMYRESVRNEYRELLIRHNCHPFKRVIVAFCQFPFWVCSTFALRNICFMFPKRDAVAHQDYLEFTNGGFGWMMDLTVMDPTYTLPVLSGLFNLTAVEIQRMVSVYPETTAAKILINVTRLVIICIVPILAFIPSGLMLFWVTNSFLGILQTLLLASPKFRRLVKIPISDFELKEPYRKLLESLKSLKRFGRKPNTTKL